MDAKVEATAVLIARCAEHGLHGQREACDVCGGPVEQVAMVPAGELERCVALNEAQAGLIEKLDKAVVARAGSPEHLRTLAGVLMQHHVKARWWELWLKARTYREARSLARRSLGWPR